MTLKKLTILIAAVAVSLGADAARVNQFGVDTKVCDPVLIYTGGLAKRPTWDRQTLMSVVTHKYSDGHTDWFYDAFIFNEVQWGNTMLCNSVVGSIPATKVTWTAFLDHLFADTHDITALDNLIGELKPLLGEPRMTHKVIISYCLPCMDKSYRSPDGGDAGFKWTKYYWGQINGVDMDFSKPQDRITAVKWFVDEAIRRFKEKKYQNIELAGFYCVEEDMNVRTSNSDIIASINDYVASLGYNSYWIPYWGAGNDAYVPYWSDKYHFSMAYWQPNYFFKTSSGSLPSLSQLTSCITRSKLYGLGLELEFETVAPNNGLNEVSPSTHQRLVDYIDTYEEKGVWSDSGVAHYGGSAGFINMYNSSDAVNKATMDRLATFVSNRQKKFALGVESVETDTEYPFAVGGKGDIFIPSDYPYAAIYSLSGALLHQGPGTFACAQGIYIVTDGQGRSLKIRVK